MVNNCQIHFFPFFFDVTASLSVVWACARFLLPRPMHRTVHIGSPPGGESIAVAAGALKNLPSDALSLGILTRVNAAKDSSGFMMYSEWASLQQTIQCELNDLSVLNKFPANAGKEVATAIVKQLAQNLGISSTTHCEPSKLEDDKDVLWCMEVLSYGLSLPLCEHDTIRDSVNVYCEWLMALLKPKICTPKPVCEDPNRYARLIIKHFYSLFVPRADSNTDTINRQAVLCHRVLRMLQKIARDSKVLVRETWEAMLMFLLAINDTLLAPPTVKDDIGDQLCERILSVLFEIWLLACANCFPSPSLWKTFHDMCSYWRHRAALIEQWNRVNITLTSKLLKFMYGPLFPELKVGEELHLSLPEMTNDCVAQSWFRFLHIIGNPVELCYPTVISNTPKFLQYAITSEHVVDPCQHKCLTVLPQIFLKSMRGISVLVDAFLGIAQYSVDEFHVDLNKTVTVTTQNITPPQQRKPAKSFSSSAAKVGLPKTSLISLTTSKPSSAVVQVQQSAVTHPSTPVVAHQPYPFTSSVATSFDARLPLAHSRPKCNSILHLFGVWLFEAALIGSKFHFSNKEGDKGKRPSSLVLENKKGSGQSFPETSDIPPELAIHHYESGRAEAIGTLCRIICAKKTGEDILPVYLARFYLAVQQGLRVSEQFGGQVLCGILMNSCDLLRLDLDGVMVLVPDIIAAIEKVLNERNLQFRVNFSVPHTELRRAAIHLLLSMLPLPLHFRSLPIKDILGGADRLPVTFQNLRPRLINLLVSALQSEVDSINTQMLLGGLLFCIQDVAMSEEEDQVPLQQDSLNDSTTALLTSANLSDTFSSHSASDCTSSSVDDSDSVADHSAADSVYSLFVRTIVLVCQCLISYWKTDWNVSLAALELLSGFAKIKLPGFAHRFKESQEANKSPVKWICDYIVHQCSRPPPFHSKDLHSTIVAAFRCVTIWLLEHPYLLKDLECLNTVMEVVELGISGTKSLSKPGDLPRMKGEKENKPASMRVRDAAEAVLPYILEHIGYFPSPCGHASLTSLLDEENLLCFCNSWNGSNSMFRESAAKHFKYYIMDNSILMALLEQPLGNDQDPQPTVTAIIRGPFGRNAWTMQLRHLPRHKSGKKMYPVDPGRPVPMTDHPIRHNHRPRYFPETVTRIQPCKAERSITTLESLITDKFAENHEKLARLVETQVTFEKNIEKKYQTQKTDYPNPETECKAPSVCQEFETARLFLSHFGFLSQEALKETLECGVPSLMALNSSDPGFAVDIEALDSMSNRTCDTAFVFYVKSGQKTAQEILSNVNSSQNVHPHFLEFLLSLGWPVDVAKHPGWTGHISTSWKMQDSLSDDAVLGATTYKDHGGSLYNGQLQVLYWSDAMAEIAFIVPSVKLIPSAPATSESAPESLRSEVSFERGSTERQTMPPSLHSEFNKPRTLSLDLEKPPLKDKDSPSDVHIRKIGRQQSSLGYDTKVLIVWLERYEDRQNFPVGDILLETSTGLEAASFTPRSTQEKDAVVIFIHALHSGLFRIEMQGQTRKISMAIPLVGGMVVSRRVLGTLVRQTSLNMCFRKRLENDSHYPPHLRRKLKIQDIVHKYRHNMTDPEFYTSLFNSPSN